ncbi:response regulator [Derxia gummosa]|uniref:Response regulator n=1 Tax=Derxia gummosa DSM 723 TaxID=1121388 RepID=A0A8B6XAC7_9BURK|nr:response regulator [Derxia gummosa]
MANILVVDDEIGIRELLSEILGDEGHVVFTAENAAKARDIRQEERIDLVLLDIWMPECDGVTLLKEWGAQQLLTMPVIMMSGHATIDTAVEATRYGALDFLEKPVTMQKLLTAVQKGLQRGQMLRVAHPAPVATVATPVSLAGSAPALTSVQFDAQPAAPLPRSIAPALPIESAPIVNLDQPLRDARDEFERLYFEHHLAKEHGSMTRVAERTGLERTHLYRKLKQLGVELGRGTRRVGAARDSVASADRGGYDDSLAGEYKYAALGGSKS